MRSPCVISGATSGLGLSGPAPAHEGVLDAFEGLTGSRERPYRPCAAAEANASRIHLTIS